MDDLLIVLKELSLKLAHELGHIALHMNEIANINCNLRKYEKFNWEEEVEAWKFAYELIKLKNDFHKRHICDKYTYPSEDQLAASIYGIIETSGHPDSDKMVKSLKKAGIYWDKA